MAAICGGNLTVWAYLDVVNNPKLQGAAVNLTWQYLRHVDSWEIAQTTQEATRKRTSTTGGAAIKFCPDTVSYDINVTNTITPDEQWVYGAILNNFNKMAIGTTAWFFLGFDQAFNPSTNPTFLEPDNDLVVISDTPTTAQLDTNGTPGSAFSHHNNGFYTYGTVVPPGFSGSNDGQDPVTGDWSIAVSTAPLPPTPAVAARTDGFSPIWTLPATTVPNP